MLPNLSLYADFLMVAASAGAGIYCLILSRRLSRLSSFDKGIGGAIAVLSAQVDEMKAALSEARTGTDGACQQLQEQVRQAREISGELELMIAACHDFAEEAMVVQGVPPLALVDTATDHPASEIAAPVPPELPPPTAEDVTQPLVFESRRAAAAQSSFMRHGQG